jgi:MoaA/NifB/PqqE/SkfB family radical SAM enzyme
VDFGGGEPTLRKDLAELARAAKKLGYERIGVKSNGLRLCYPDVVSELLDAGVGHFALSVWGASSFDHDALSQTEGSFEKLEMAVKHVLDLGGEVSAEVLLTTETVPRLEALTHVLSELGVREFHLWLYSLFGSGQALPELLPRLSEAGRAIAWAAWSAEKDARFSTTHVPPCFLPGAEEIYENIAASDLVIVTPGNSFLAETSPFEAGMKTPRCGGCGEEARCAGLRPEYLERFSDAEVRPVRAAGRLHGTRR